MLVKKFFIIYQIYAKCLEKLLLHQSFNLAAAVISPSVK